MDRLASSKPTNRVTRSTELETIIMPTVAKRSRAKNSSEPFPVYLDSDAITTSKDTIRKTALKNWDRASTDMVSKKNRVGAIKRLLATSPRAATSPARLR